VERYSQALFGEKSAWHFKGLCCVVPNVNGLVTGAGHDQLLADANVKTSDLILVEVTLNVVENDRVWWSTLGIAIEFSSNHLALVRDNIDVVLLFIDAHAFNDVVTTLVGGFSVN